VSFILLSSYVDVKHTSIPLHHAVLFPFLLPPADAGHMYTYEDSAMKPTKHQKRREEGEGHGNIMEG
jgi:hypothetical protein